jgi:hypothetical protein
MIRRTDVEMGITANSWGGDRDAAEATRREADTAARVAGQIAAVASVRCEIRSRRQIDDTTRRSQTNQA